MTGRALVAGLIGLTLIFSAGSGAASANGPDLPPASSVAREAASPMEAVHYRVHKHGRNGYRRADEPFILRQPDYGLLPYIYGRRANYPYRCVPTTAAQFFYCRERFVTVDPVTGAWVSYAPYGHLCYCY